MKKVLIATVVCVTLLSVFAAESTQAAEKGGGGPAILSAIMPGVGEWMNSDFQGVYPFGECIVGYVCFPFMFSSVIDAANGNADTGIRLDFWSAPKK